MENEPKIDMRKKENRELSQEKFVSNDKFEQLVGMVGEIAKTVNDLKIIQGNPLSTPQPTPQPVVEEAVDRTHLPPRWREICDEVLGKDFGLNVTYPDTGKGFLLKVIVPRDKSNAPTSHWEFYKADIRTKAIGFGEGVEGVKMFYEKVKKNLNLNQANIKG